MSYPLPEFLEEFKLLCEKYDVWSNFYNLYCGKCKLIWLESWARKYGAKHVSGPCHKGSGVILSFTGCPKCGNYLWTKPREYSYAVDSDLPKESS